MRSKIEFKWGMRTLAEEGHATARESLYYHHHVVIVVVLRVPVRKQDECHDAACGWRAG
jgi:hypothetical protein